MINPLVDWIWFGFAVIAIGTGIALLPERAYSFAVANLPSEIATTTTTLLVLLAVLGTATTPRSTRRERDDDPGHCQVTARAGMRRS